MFKRKATSSPFDDIQMCNKKIKTDDNNNLFDCVNAPTVFPLQYLPDLVLEAIFKNLTYHEIATLRIVCRRFDVIGRWLLNKGLRVLQQKISNIVERAEELATPWKNILNFFYEIYFRLSMLDLVFSYHIMKNRCCFFPGKVLDVIKDTYVFMVNQVDTLDVKLVLWNRCLNIKRVYKMAVKHAMEIIFPAFMDSVEQTSDVFSTSSPLLFDHFVFSASFNSLEFFYFNNPETMIKLSASPEFVNMINLFKMIEIKDDNPRLVYERGLIAEGVMREFLHPTNV